MSYLRFTPHEYRTIRSVCRQQDAGHHPQATFQRLLVAALGKVWPGLAAKVARLSREKMTLLYHHFHPFPAAGEPHGLTPEELLTLEQMCVSVPFPVRFVRPFKGLLVEMLKGCLPDLARKVDRMSSHRFEAFYYQAVGRQGGDA